MNKHHVLILLLAIALGIAAYLYLPPAGEDPEPLPLPDPAPATEPAPEIRYPVPAPEPGPDGVSVPRAVTEPPVSESAPAPAGEETPALPPLQDSDEQASRSLVDVFEVEGLGDWLRPAALIRHLVATIDNLPRERLAEKLRPVQPAQGVFTIGGDQDQPLLSPENYRRYAPYVALAETVDLDRLVDWYIRYYPLFQEAYLDLGYPEGYFNDRLVEVIDHLLATPEVQQPVQLERPHVLYRFADPELESLSAGRKLLIRMGPDHAARIKALLRELRSRLTAYAPVP